MTPAASLPIHRKLLARVAAALLVALLLSACSGDDRLPILRDEPVLAAPPGAVELARSETGGDRWPVGTAARVQILWGVHDAEAAVDWYLDNHGDTYALDLNHDEEWLGGRAVGETGIAAHVRLWEELDDVRWGTYHFEQDQVDPWDGPVVAVSVSTGG